MLFDLYFERVGRMVSDGGGIRGARQGSQAYHVLCQEFRESYKCMREWIDRGQLDPFSQRADFSDSNEVEVAMATSILSGLFIPNTPKRKVFVSYHHGGDQAYYNAFSENLGTALDIFTDRSLERARDSDNPTYIMRYIREKHLTGASTLIVLCGAETPRRKYVDWEILAGLGQGMALIGVGLPTIRYFNNGGTDKPLRLQDNIDSGYAVWAMWAQFLADPAGYIEAAHHRAKSKIDNARARRVRNG